MKVIIAGSRSITSSEIVFQLIESTIKENDLVISEVVSGGANGVDSIGEEYAISNNLPIKKFVVKWDDIYSTGSIVKLNKYGKKYNVMAGFIRNQEMADYADVLIAITTGSSGTNDMISRATKNNLLVYIHKL